MARLVRHVLEDILEAIDGIENAVRDRTISDYKTDWLLRHAIQRGIEIVSEATKRIPEELRSTQPTAPWQDILGIGNILRHEYYRVSDDIIWRVVCNHPPPLRAAIVAIDSALIEDE